jgi:hypothetical protein
MDQKTAEKLYKDVYQQFVLPESKCIAIFIKAFVNAVLLSL